MKDVKVDEMKMQELKPVPFQNKLAEQDNKFMNKSFNLDTNHNERMKEFAVDDCIKGYFPRARSGGSVKYSREKMTRRYHSDSTVLSSSKLPSIDQTCSDFTRTCTLRPWSKTCVELQKYKDALSNV